MIMWFWGCVNNGSKRDKKLNGCQSYVNWQGISDQCNICHNYQGAICKGRLFPSKGILNKSLADSIFDRKKYSRFWGKGSPSKAKPKQSERLDTIVAKEHEIKPHEEMPLSVRSLRESDDTKVLYCNWCWFCWIMTQGMIGCNTGPDRSGPHL